MYTQNIKTCNYKPRVHTNVHRHVHTHMYTHMCTHTHDPFKHTCSELLADKWTKRCDILTMFPPHHRFYLILILVFFFQISIFRAKDRETLWTEEEKRNVLGETKSQTHPEADGHELLEMFHRSCVTTNLSTLKDFLFHLSLSSMSYAQEKDAWWQNATTNAIKEILIFYNNELGSMSFSICYTSNGVQHSKYFHEVFVNLNKYFKDQQLLLYVSFKSIFNSGLTIEFLGSCLSHPISWIEHSLANKSRFFLTQLRAQSALQKVTKFAMQYSSGYYALRLFYPLLARSCRFGDVNDILDINTLLQLYAHLNPNQDLPAPRNQRKRLALVSRYPRHKVFVDRRELNWLHFLTFYVFQYFDGRFPNERPIIRDWAVQANDA